MVEGARTATGDDMADVLLRWVDDVLVENMADWLERGGWDAILADTAVAASLCAPEFSLNCSDTLTRLPPSSSSLSMLSLT